MTTALNTIDVKYVIKNTDSKVYTTNNIHLELTNSVGVAIINNPTVVAQVANTTNGLVTFTDVPLEERGNTIKMYVSDIDDLDNNPTITKLGSTYIRRIGTSPTEVEL